jgi:hypothetical protein
MGGFTHEPSCPEVSEVPLFLLGRILAKVRPLISSLPHLSKLHVWIFFGLQGASTEPISFTSL